MPRLPLWGPTARHMAPDAAPDGLGQRRLYPRLKVVTEDYERDCYLVTPSRAAASKSFELLAAFRKAGGEWMPGRTASRWAVPRAPSAPSTPLRPPARALSPPAGALTARLRCVRVARQAARALGGVWGGQALGEQDAPHTKGRGRSRAGDSAADGRASDAESGRRECGAVPVVADHVALALRQQTTPHRRARAHKGVEAGPPPRRAGSGGPARVWEPEQDAGRKPARLQLPGRGNNAGDETERGQHAAP